MTLFIVVEMQHVVLYCESSLATSRRDSFFTVISAKRIEVLFTSAPVASKIAPNENLTFFHNFPFSLVTVCRSRETAYIFLRPRTLHEDKYTEKEPQREQRHFIKFLSLCYHSVKILQSFLAG